MKITVIGRWGAYPKRGEATAGFLVEVGNHKILLDCGSGVLSVLQNGIELHELTTVFISHNHFDHMADLGALQYACLIDMDLKQRETPLPLFIAKDAKDEWTIPVLNGTIEHEINQDTVVSLENGLTLTFFQTDHDVYCLGVKLSYEGKSLVYTADTRYDESLVPYLKDADLLITEASFYANFDAARYGHMTSTEAGLLASKAGVKKLLLTHLPHFGDIQLLKEEAALMFQGEVILAECGLQVVL
ncbi:MBL fold metallo-hydrolase [Paenibacillus qinlingensis]|uniref:MBL fold metallo-hydrolase n=1 Tax=Paenibacillus qinlingensis TaxID=1837343 RepID=UPI001563B490|nr:MBL fold metallo-hydrolase [Paenibacillus qinlingensis]NQX58164.1 MBL fold metallo-hydrolase [Paenibacillus qinlingensis]